MWEQKVKTVHPLVRELMDLDVSKSRIASFCGVGWQNVDAWTNAYYGPLQQREDKLRELIQIVLIEKGWKKVSKEQSNITI